MVVEIRFEEIGFYYFVEEVFYVCICYCIDVECLCVIGIDDVVFFYFGMGIG